MNDPWFDPNVYAWIPGTIYGTSLGIFGGLSGSLAGAGKARTCCLAVWGVFATAAVLLLAIGLAAYSSGQPYGIWSGFGLPGVLGLILCPMLLHQQMLRYREAEDRRMQAADFDRS